MGGSIGEGAGVLLPFGNCGGCGTVRSGALVGVVILGSGGKSGDAPAIGIEGGLLKAGGDGGVSGKGEGSEAGKLGLAVSCMTI